MRRLLLALGAGVLISVYACTGDGQGGPARPALSLEEYFQQLGALDARFEDQSSQVEASLELLDDEMLLADAPEILREEFDLIDRFRSNLEGLGAPADVRDEHAEAVEAWDRLVDEFGEVLQDVDDARSLPDLFGALGDESLTSAITRVQSACDALQGVADAHAIDAQLSCRTPG